MKIKKLKGKTLTTSLWQQCTPAYEYVTVSLRDIMRQGARKAKAAVAKTA